jgi:hypothetical protein
VQDLAFRVAGPRPGQDLLSVLIIEVAGHDRDQVHEKADEETSEGEQIDEPGDAISIMPGKGWLLIAGK